MNLIVKNYSLKDFLQFIFTKQSFFFENNVKENKLIKKDMYNIKYWFKFKKIISNY